ncbi:Holliday junction branch migration protein RuvA [bacterium]|nr:Holliday junction branch migration protein RuvA [bacterium]
MIESITGRLVEKLPTSVVIDNSGIGYKAHVPLSTYHKLPEKPKEVTLFTHLVVKEESVALYGFFTLEEREIFWSLTSIAGIGPKGALSILSQITSLRDFKLAIGRGEVNFLTKFSGIGKKTAERIILELKERYKVLEEDQVFFQEKDQIFFEEALMALVSLGFKKNQALIALSKVKENLPQIKNVEEIIRKSLSYL